MYMTIFMDMCMDMCTDMCMGMRTDMCIVLCMTIFVDMRSVMCIDTSLAEGEQLRWFWIHTAKHLRLGEWAERAQLLRDVACFERSLTAWFGRNYPTKSMAINQFLLQDKPMPVAQAITI